MSPPATAPHASTLTPDRVRLSGVSLRLDHRVHAFRRDLACVKLAGKVIAPHYALAAAMDCAAGQAPIHGQPRADSATVTELLYGECFDVLEVSGGWAWGRSAHDGYVGYIRSDHLRPAGPAATHRISERLGLVFAEASIKAQVVVRLPLGALIHAEAAGDFLKTERGYLHVRHAAELGAPETDPVAVAERLLGAPYGWGGRSQAGVDCSGLVQVALGSCGIAAPRDTDQQREALGQAVDPGSPVERGDLVYFPGHVGIMADGERLLHANAHWMSTVIEPLADVIDRLRPKYDDPVLAVRRVSLAA